MISVKESVDDDDEMNTSSDNDTQQVDYLAVEESSSEWPTKDAQVAKQRMRCDLKQLFLLLAVVCSESGGGLPRSNDSVAKMMMMMDG